MTNKTQILFRFSEQAFSQLQETSESAIETAHQVFKEGQIHQ